MGEWGRLMFGAVAVICMLQICAAYNTGDFVPMSRRGQYHNMRTEWHPQLGRYCPRFGLDKEVVMPVPKPVGYTGSDEYKLSFQFEADKFSTPWLLVIGRQGPNVPMIDVTLKHTGGDLVGVTAKVVNMPNKYLEQHPQVKSEYWNVEKWPKHILIRYIWEDKSAIDVERGFYVLFSSAFVLFLVTAVTILQSSKEKLARFVKENVVDTQAPGPVAKVE